MTRAKLFKSKKTEQWRSDRAIPENALGSFELAKRYIMPQVG